MTATLEAPAPARTRDLRRFWRISIALMLPLGPLGVTVVRGIMPYWTSDDPSTVVAKALDHLDVMEAMAWVGLVFTAPLLLAMLVLGYVARRGAPVLATLGAVLSFLAYANWGAAGNPDYLMLVLGEAGYDAPEVVRILSLGDGHALAAVSGFGWVIGHIVGMILLAVALGKARVIPTWAATALAVSQPIHLISAIILPSRLLDVTLGWGLTTLAFVLVSVAILRMTDDVICQGDGTTVLPAGWDRLVGSWGMVILLVCGVN